MTTFPHTILLNIQINQQIVCQKQKHLEKYGFKAHVMQLFANGINIAPPR
jgi:hypothetical protein